MRSRREERKARTREAILAAAQECFAAGGLAATSTQEVSAAAGVSHGTIFLHFPRREQLIERVVSDLGAELRAALGEPTAALATELDLQLRLFLHAERLLRRLLQEPSALPPSARAELADLDRLLAGRVAGAYAAERERGELRSLSPRLVAATWLALLQRVLQRGEPDAAGFSPLARWGPEIRAHLLALVAS